MLLGTLKRRGGRAALMLLAGLLIGGAVGAGTMYVLKRGKAGVPGGPRLGAADELDLVPGESAGFVHIRLRGLWNSEMLAEIRKIIDAAGPQAKATLDESFVPAPSTLDRMTLVFLKVPPATAPPKGKGKLPPPPPGPGFGGPFGGIDNIIPPAIGSDLKVVVLLAFNAPFDPAKVRDSHAKGAGAKKVGDREYYEDEGTDLALYFPDNTKMVLGDPAGIRNYLLKLNAGTAGPLAKAVEHAKEGGRHFVAALNVSQLGVPLRTFDDAPPDYKDLAKHAQTVMKAESLMLGVALTEEGTRVEIRAKYKDDAAAGESETALREMAKFARTKLADPKKDMEKKLNAQGQPRPRPIGDLPGALGALAGLGGLNALDDWLADPPLKTDGSEVVLTPKVPSVTALYAGAAAAGAVYLLGATDRFGGPAAPPVGRVEVPAGPGGAVGKVQLAAARVRDSNTLKQLGLAMHNYEATNGRFPSPNGVTPTNKKGGLSWRVHVLAYMEVPEAQALAAQFKMDEPWDGPTNKKLIEKMPAVFAGPFAPDPPGQTRYKALVGAGAAFEPDKTFRVTDFVDGLSNTILITGGGPPVIWTKPDDIAVTPTLEPAVLALPGQTGCNVCMGDGSVRWVDLGRLDPKKLKALVTRAGGEVLDFD